MAIVELSIIPLGTGMPSVGQYVAQAIKVLEKENVKYEITSMGTIIEGDLTDLLVIVRQMHEAVFSAGAMRVVTVIKIDDRRDKAASINTKLESLKSQLKL